MKHILNCDTVFMTIKHIYPPYTYNYYASRHITFSFL